MRAIRATNMLQLYTANFGYPRLLINLKWWSCSFELHQVFPTLMVQMIFSQIQMAPGPDFREVGKSFLFCCIQISTWEKDERRLGIMFDTFILRLFVEPLLCSG